MTSERLDILLFIETPQQRRSLLYIVRLSETAPQVGCRIAVPFDFREYSETVIIALSNCSDVLQ